MTHDANDVVEGAVTFLVVKQGVYIQEVYGPFDEFTATAAARTLAATDRDDYHTYDVRSVRPAGLGVVVASFAQEPRPGRFCRHDEKTVRVTPGVAQEPA